MPITIPKSLPNAPGEIETLFNVNDNYLYSKFSPYTNYKGQLLGGILSDQQPFVYTTIDEGQSGGLAQLPSVVQNFGSIVGITQDSVDDVERVSKFLISSWGVQFLLTQVAIQRLAPFDETRVYNPLSPLLATVQPLTIGLGNLPVRHVQGNLITGLLNSVTSTVGINISGNASAPSSTVGDSALSTTSAGQGKGLIRGADANLALTTLKSKWISSNGSNGSTGLGGFLSSVGAAFNSFFGSPQQSPGTYRADEQTADLMYNSKIIYITQDGDNAYFSWYMPWYSDSNTGNGSNTNNVKLFPSPQNQSQNIPSPNFTYQKISDKSNKTISNNLGGTLSVGYTPNTNGGNYGNKVYLAKYDGYTNSEVLMNFADYAVASQKYTTKLSDPSNDNVISMNNQLSQVIQGINQSSKIYSVSSAVLSGLLPSAIIDGSPLGYDRINTIKDLNSNTGPNSARQEYKYGSPGVSGKTVPKSIDETFKQAGGTSLRMGTSFLSDGMNMLGILPNSQQITDPTVQSVYPGWTDHKEYDDDLVAFFFYDVVNSVFIPFRATVKGISEGNTAFWDELRFIGRADQLYSYNGFSRTLTFTFNVVISSVSELLPSWKKINYMASSVKPSNYTHGQTTNQSFNRFIVPPMFMLTIGDLYRFQPIIITSINVNTPDDASWETLNEKNAPKGWSYLNGIISSPTVAANYGQLPREAEIAVTCNLLEKERAIVGGSHFGHQPRVDDWEGKAHGDRFLTTTDTFLPPPTALHKHMVQWNDGTDTTDNSD